MKRFTFLAISFLAVFLIGMNRNGYSQFTAGNLVVLRVGDGTAALSSASTVVFLDEYTTAGASVQSVAVPSSGTNMLTIGGSSGSEGLITLSPDSYYLILPGYNSAAGVAAIAGTTSTAVNRKLLKVDNAVNYTPLLSSTAYSGGNIRGGVTYQDNFWASGSNGGVQYFGTGTPCQVSSTVANVREINIFNGQLYFSTGSGTTGVWAVGTGLPIVTGQTSTVVVSTIGTGSGTVSPYGFAFNTSSDICYIADDRSTANGGGIQKFTKTGGIWSLSYTLSVGGTTGGARGITVDWSGPNPVIYATTAEASANRIVKIIDVGASSTFTLLYTAGTNTAYRGIAFAPSSGTVAPTIQATNITFSGITTTGMTASWTVGNGAKRIVIMNTTNSFTNPTDGTDPIANTVYGGSGQQVVYNNNGNSVSVTGMNANTTYWFRVYEYNGSGSGTKYLTPTATGNPNSQATNGPPTVTTIAASGLSPTGGTLNGTVNANGYSTVVTFDFGLTPGYGTSYTAAQSPVTGNTSTAVSYIIASGLAPNTLYHYRAVGVNSQGTTNGLDISFTTSAIAPTVTTNAATIITGITATINGTVNANNASTAVTFDYGVTTGYGTTVTAIQSPVTGGINTAVSYNLTGLIPNTLYHFRVNGVNIGGTSNGSDLTFTTSAIVPIAVTMSATGVGATTASFNGTVTANNSSSTVSFDYGTTIAYGTTVTGIPSPVTGMIPMAVVYNATGLAINTLYHFRVCATNSAGSSCGNDLTFTTGCPLPAPAGTITGSSIVCQTLCGYTYTVPTIAGATGYIWGVPTGATITSGANTNSITVCYSSSAVSGNVSVYGNNVCGNGSSSSFAVTVNSLPTVTLAGPASVCAGATSNVYTTEAGMSNYIWAVSAGGAPTAGGTATNNTVTVTWNTIGAQTVSVNYTNAGGCTAAAPTVYNVTVNARPTPTITGPATACAPSPGNVYTTQAGMTNYTWTVSAGGTITAGTGTNAITVSWITAGAQTVCVNYTNGSGCSATVPACYIVTVNVRPVPTITGPASVCGGISGSVYTTEAGMSGYTWTVSAGGVITAGAGTNAITVTWNTPGAQTVCVNYTNGSGCSATTPTCYAVTVNAVPVPTITGPSTVCSGSTGNVYTTQAGMTNYLWTVSAGGQVTAGGTPTSNTVTVKWNTAGAQSVGVNYTNAGNCSASAPTSYPVTVNATPVPTITGTTTLCVNSGYYTYTTEAGMTAYTWTVSSGGIINNGSGTYQVTVSWVTAGAQTISVNYTAPGGCSAASPTVKNITVNPLPGPAGTITGIPSVCAGTSGFHYSVAPITNATTYVWNLPAGATITSGYGTNDIVVSYSTTAVSGNITVQGNNLCGFGTISPPYPVIVIQLPAAAGTITGNNSVCEGDAGISYTVSPIANATSYEWTVPTGAIIVGGENTNSITVDFPAPSSSGNITVYGTNFCGNGTVSPNFAVTVKPVPAAPVVTNTGYILYSSAPSGNQWYYSATLSGTGAPISGATAQTYDASQTGTGYYWSEVTLNGCSSGESNHQYVVITGVDSHSSSSINIYPVPNDGQFNVSITTASDESFSISIYNSLGMKIYEETKVDVNGSLQKVIDLRPMPNGVYTVIFENRQNQVEKKIIVNK